MWLDFKLPNLTLKLQLQSLHRSLGFIEISPLVALDIFWQGFVLVQHVSSKDHFRYGRTKILLVDLWMPMTAWYLAVRTQALNAEWAFFKIQGFVCKRFLPSLPSPTPHPRFFVSRPIFRVGKTPKILSSVFLCSQAPQKCLLHGLIFWPVSNFKAPIQFAFMIIISLSQREIHFGSQNFIIQALHQC